MRTSVAAAWLAALTLLASGCAERRSPVDIQAHPPEWNAPESSSFHGARIGEEKPVLCAECHGADFRGADGVPGCYECHAGPGGHPWGWTSEESGSFHGDAVEDAGPSGCRLCHGDDYRGGWSEVSCYTCHAGGPSGHPDGWLEERASSFHGLLVVTQGVDDCRRCHGFGLSGGTSGVGCGDCHL
jgi:hypothetical protein